MTTNQDVQTLEETLERTDLGHIINENKKSVLAAAAVIVVGVIGYVIFGKIQNQKETELLNKVYELDKTVFTAYIDGKSDAATFKSELSKIDSKLMTFGNAYPGLLAGLNKLNEAGELDEVTMNTVQAWLDQLDKRSNLYLINGLTLAALWEDQGQVDKALSIYQEMVKRPDDLMKDRIFFSVGRMYIKKGDKEQAQKHFDFIFKEYADTQYAKLARIYLSEL